MTAKLMERVVKTRLVIQGAGKLVAHHMKVMQFYQNQSTDKGFKRLALKLSPEADLELLAALALADSRGVNPAGGLPLEEGSEMVDWFLERARRSRVHREPEKPVLKGRHLAGIIAPGPAMGRVLEEAYRIQIEEGVKDIEVLKKRALEMAGKREATREE